MPSGQPIRSMLIEEVHISELADRIEAAAKREKAQPSNAAAMLAALQKIRKVAVLNIYENVGDYSDERIIEIVDAALAAPPRQCDVGTAEEQSVRMSEFCREQYKKTDGVALCSGCRFHNIEGLDCQFAWAQLPYEAREGGAK